MDSPNADSPSNDYAHIIVFGNEKGGSGKSTAAMHVVIGLLRLGYSVGTIDLDARQGTMTQMLKNRWAYVHEHQIDLPDPLHMMIDKSLALTLEEQQEQERSFMDMALNELSLQCDFIVIDTPGTDNHLSRLAHRFADTLITPLNDSMIDLDLLLHFDESNKDAPAEAGVYTEMLEEQRMRKKTSAASKAFTHHTNDIHWIVMRNRRSHLNMKLKDKIDETLREYAEKFAYSYIEGFGERVIFRELFEKGLTVLDLKQSAEKRSGLSLSEISARQEIRNLIAAIDPVKHKGYRKVKTPKKKKHAEA